MALVQYGGGVLDARGSIGGQVHSKNRFGNYIRARTTPVNPQSTRQNFVRNIVQYLSQRWSNTLTQLQRDGWEVYAAAITRANKLGAQIKLTGFNHYINSFVDACTAMDSRFIRGIYQNSIPNVELKEEYVCGECDTSTMIDVPFTTDFFWPQR